MGIYAIFHEIVASIVILILSMPFAAFGQQNPMRTEVSETPAAEDADAVRLVALEAKAAAEQDASGNTNKLLWSGAGAGIGCLGGAIGGFTGCLIGQKIDPSGGLGFAPLLDFGDGEGAGCSIGAAVGVLIPYFILARSYQTDPPPERLLGKSPEYIEFYTHVYRKKTRSLRRIWATTGTVVGVLGAPVLLGMLIRE